MMDRREEKTKEEWKKDKRKILRKGWRWKREKKEKGIRMG